MAKCPDGHESSSDDYCDVCGVLMTGSASASAPPASAGSAGSAPGAVSAAAVPGGAGAEPCPNCNAPRSGQFCESCGFNFATGQAPPPAAPPPPATEAPATGPFNVVPPDPAAPPSAAAASPSAASPSAASPAAASPDAAAPGYASSPSASSGPASPPVSPAPSVSAWSVVVSADRAYYDGVLAASGADGADIPFPPYCPDRRFQLTGAQIQIGRRSPSRGLDPEIDLTGPPLDPGVSRLHAVLIATPDGGWAVLDPGSANGTQVNGADIPTGVQVPLHDGDRVGIGAWTTITVHAG